MTARRDVWLDGEHFTLTEDEYTLVTDAVGSPKSMTPDELEPILEYLRRCSGASSGVDRDGFDAQTTLDCETAAEILEEGQTRIEPVSTAVARDHAEYWVMIYGTGTQRKGVHVPADDSTRDDPALKCGRSVCDDARLVAKDLEVFPRGYDPDRICTDCRRELAEELGGDRRVE